MTASVFSIAADTCPSRVAAGDDVYEAFREAAHPPPPEERTGEPLLRWHRRVLERMQALLDRQGVRWEPYDYPDGEPGLRIAPGGDSALNALVSQLGERLSVSFVYSPRHLLRGKHHVSHAKFNRNVRRITLSHDIVEGPAEDDSLHHEILHAVFDWFFRSGVDSLFHGRFEALDDDEPMWESDSYSNRMSFEELATTALNLRLLALRLRAEQDPEKIGRMLKRLEKKARTLAALGAETSGVLKEWIRLIESGKGRKKLRLTFEREDGVLWARGQRRNVDFAMPLLRGGGEAELLARLRDLRRLAKRLAREADNLGNVLERGDREEIYRAACAPRTSTLPWIRMKN